MSKVGVNLILRLPEAARMLTRRAAMRSLCELKHTMKNAKLYRVQGRRVEFEMAVELGSASLEFYVVSKDMKYEAACEARYPSRYSR